MSIGDKISKITMNSVLVANGLFSVSSGLLIALFSTWLTGQFGLATIAWFLGIGLTLMVYGSVLLAASKSTHPNLMVAMAAEGDLSWVVMTTWILVNPSFFGLSLTTPAIVLTVLTTLIVLDFAVIQLHLLARTPSSHTVSETVDGTVDEAWEVIADLEGYVNYTSLIRTDLVQTDNDTIVRECEDSRGSWRETQVDYTTNESYTMEVDTSDYPYPFRYFAGTWSVKEIEEKTEISMTFSWVPKGWIFGKLVFAFLLPGMIRKGVTQTIEKYEQRIIANRSVALQDRSRRLNPISSLANT